MSSPREEAEAALEAALGRDKYLEVMCSRLYGDGDRAACRAAVRAAIRQVVAVEAAVYTDTITALAQTIKVELNHWRKLIVYSRDGDTIEVTRASALAVESRLTAALAELRRAP